MISIYAITIPPEAEKTDFAGLLPLLAPDKRRRIDAMRRKESALQSLYGELLARMAVALRQRVPVRAIRFQCAASGKPEIVGGGLCFNVGHSRDRVVCAISAAAVGVDVEAVRPIGMDIARRFFTADECADILRAPEAERLQRFFRTWTLKESYLKAVGSGLALPLNSFAMQVQGESITIRGAGTDAAAYGFRSWLWDDVCWLSLCAQERPLPATFRVIPGGILRQVLGRLNADTPFQLPE